MSDKRPAKSELQLSDVAASEELLAYYKKRVDDFESERQELLQRIDRCAAQQADIHRLDWESKKRADEVRELQKALSDAHTYLFAERERLLQLQAENDDLKLQEVEDRKKIQHLLALHQPLEQEITYQRQGRPNTLTVFPRGGDSGAGGPAQSRNGGGEGSERVMRTVYLPAADSDSLMLKLESLQAQLNEQRQFAIERIAALLEDRRIREADEEAHRAVQAQKMEELVQRLKKTESTLQATTKDYILARRDKQEAESRAATAEATLTQEQQRAKSEVLVITEKGTKELENLRKESDARLEEYVSKLRLQVKRKQEENADLDNVHSAVKAQLERRIDELEVKVSKLQESNKALEVRRALDVEGWFSDITILRKQLAAADRKLHQMRLVNRLQDDERLDALLEDLERRAPGVVLGPNNADAASDAGSTATGEVGGDLRRVRQALAGVENRVQKLKREQKGGQKKPQQPKGR